MCQPLPLSVLDGCEKQVIVFLLEWLRVWRCLRRKEFAQALGAAQRRQNASAWQLEAYYRLGMYQSAAQAAQRARTDKQWAAAVVAMAACGEHQAVQAALQTKRAQALPVVKLIQLADDLAPFMPETAWQLVQPLGGRAPAALRMALLLRTGQQQLAQASVEQLSASQYAQQPELHLYASMAQPQSSPAQQLQRLNAFLHSSHVPPLVLKDPALPPGPGNVAVAEPVQTVQGPLVSVLVTSYRTGQRAVRAVESLLQQSYRNLEVIVVDDASGDATPQLLAQLAQQDARVRVLALPVNVGTYAAKSIGLQAARGEFVTCHDSDDWAHPCKIARQVQPLLADPALVATTSHWLRMQDDGMFYARPVHPLMRINPSSLLFRREAVLAKAGAWDCVRTGADSEFYARLRLVFGKKAVKRVVQPLSLGAHRPGSLMTDAQTGYSEQGLSAQRLDYWESWSRWHIECLARGKTPYLGLLATQRAFAAPQGIVVPAAHMHQALQALQAGAIQIQRAEEA